MTSNKRMRAVLLLAAMFSTTVTMESMAEIETSRAYPPTVTLLCRATHEDYQKAEFNFAHGLRGDGNRAVTRNYYDIEYGSINIAGHCDWFSVSISTDARSRIKDLGEKGWADVHAVPVLPPRPASGGGIRMPSKPTESYEQSSDGQVTQVVAGHLYVLHIKRAEVVDRQVGDADRYVLLRVEDLLPNDRCTISWKIVPSPEKLEKPTAD